MISARVIEDSVNPYSRLSGGKGRLTTMSLRFPRIVLSELLTHRAFSRNASSSRAIPVAKLLAEAESDPAVPIHWGANQKGMQATERVSDEIQKKCELEWHLARRNAIDSARRLMDLGLHKQLANRLLEPFTHISVVLTGTNEAYENFYALRRHPDAEPHIHALANVMFIQHAMSTPAVRKHHLPFLDEELRKELGVFRASLVSAARCARVSYLKHDGSAATVEEDLALANKLSESGHFSPLEHQAEACEDTFKRFGNFVGWAQYRKMKPNERQSYHIPEGADYV